MLAVEFNTTIDKPYIEVPNYEELKGHKVNIVVLDLENNDSHQENIAFADSSANSINEWKDENEDSVWI